MENFILFLILCLTHFLFDGSMAVSRLYLFIMSSVGKTGDEDNDDETEQLLSHG